MNRSHLAVLLISGILLAAAIPLKNTLSDPSAFVDSFPESIQTLYENRNGTERPWPKYVPGAVIIKFRKEVTEGEIVGFRIGQGAEEAYVSPFTLTRVWRVPPSKTVEEWVDFLDKHPLVEYAEPNYYAYASMTPNDPIYSYQWHLDNPTYGGIHMEAAWEIETGDSGIIVAVVDTGVAYENLSGPSFWHLDTYNAHGGSGVSWWCGVSEAPYSWTALYDTDPTPPGYGNGWKQYLQHSFDLTGATGTVTFSYYYKYDIERGYDFFYVDISDNGGATWKELKHYTNTAGSIPGRLVGGKPVDWTQDSLVLTSYEGKNVLIRFRFNSDETFLRSPPSNSDEDGVFDSDGAVYIDEVRMEDTSGTIFYDDMESGAGDWETTAYEQAPDLVGTYFWTNSDEIPGDETDNDGNGFVDDVNGWDFVNSDAHPNDDEAHGTHVAGTVAQTTNNNLGVAGVAFETTVMPVKVLNAAGRGTYQQVADGIYYAVNNGADIINLSLGGPDPSTTLENATAYAYNNGVTVFAASGNGNAGICDYPAAYDAYVIAVGATQYDETRAPYSNYGSSLDIVAPGGNTGADQNGDGYADGVLQNTFSNTTVDWSYWFYQGTSMSTPHASGVAALLLARNPTLTPDQIRNVLQSTSEDLGAPGPDYTYGWGLIDAKAALQIVCTHVHLAVQGSNNKVYHRIFDSPSGSLESWNVVPTGATCDSPAVAVVNDCLHFVVRGATYTNSLWHGYVNLTDDSFSGWANVVGATPSAPTLASDGSSLYLVVRGMNDRIYYNVWDGSWSGFTVISGATSDSPASAIVNGEVHIVVRGATQVNSLWHGQLDVSTNVCDWAGISGATPSAPTLTS